MSLSVGVMLDRLAAHPKWGYVPRINIPDDVIAAAEAGQPMRDPSAEEEKKLVGHHTVMNWRRAEKRRAAI